MHILCPHCQNPIELVKFNPREEILCASCGSSFRLEGGSTTGWNPRRGQKVGKFELIDLVGRGAFGTVYKARDPELDRVVAVKVPRAGNLGGAEDQDRFLREARSAAQLRHPSIVSVHEVGLEDGLPYLVSDFVEGVTLADLLSARRPTVPESAQFVAAVADALQYAHDRGVVHRDVKPSNIIIGPDGGPHLMDFGLAKREAGEITMTTDGQVLGTPAFMSPEQARGEAHQVDGRSDVYSLGVILYQLLTGELPFRGNPRMLLHQVLHDEPRSPRSLNDRIPRDLETVCLKAMAKEPARRYRTAADLATDIRRFLTGEPIKARPVTRRERLWRWCRRNPAVATLAAAVVLLLVAVAGGATVAAIHFGAMARQEERLKQDAQDKAEESRRRLVRLHVEKGVRLMNDGDLSGALLWFTEALRLDQGDAEREKTHRLRIAAVLRQCPRPVRLWFAGGNLAQAHFSRDGRRVLTSSGSLDQLVEMDVVPPDNEARVWEAGTGRPLTPPLTYPGLISGAAFSWDGRRVVTVHIKVRKSDAGKILFHRSAVLVWDVATAARVGPALKRAGAVEGACLSRDGRQVVTWGGTGKPRRFRMNMGPGQARIWELASGKPVTPPLEHPAGVYQAQVSPDGRRLVTGDKSGVARIWDTATGKLLKTLSNPRDRNARQPLEASFSPDGRRVLTFAMVGRVWDVATGEPVTPPLEHPNSTLNFALFSPDGTRVLTAAWQSFRVWDATTGKPVTGFLIQGSSILSVRFSGDSRQIVTAGSDGAVRVWNAATGTAALPPLCHRGRVLAAVLSQGGRQVRTISAGGTGQVWDVATGEAAGRPVGHDGSVSMAWFSPEGRRLVTTGSKKEARVWDAATGQAITPPMKHGGLVTCAAFSPNGRWVVTGSLDHTARVWDAGTGEALGHTLKHDHPVRDVAFSPDGLRVATASSEKYFETGGEARVWNAATGAPITAPLKHSGAGREVLFSSDGRRLLTLGAGPARLWDAATGKPITTFNKLMAFARFSPDDKRVVSARYGRATVWDAATGKALVSVELAGEPRHLAVHPDGRVITASGGGQILVWDLSSGELLLPPLKHGDYALCASFSPGGRRVATASMDGTARVWDAATGDPVTPLLQHGAIVDRAVISPDGRRFITVRRSHTSYLQSAVQIWPLVPEERPVADLAELAQWLAARRLAANGNMVALKAQDLKRSWQKLRGQYPSDFACAREQELAWLRRAAGKDMADKEWAAAVPHLDRLVQLEPASALHWISRGYLHSMLERWERSAADYARAIARGSDQEAVWQSMAYAHNKASQYNRAITALSKAIRRNPTNSFNWDQRSWSRYHLGQWPQVIADCAKAIELGANSEWVWNRLAWAYEKTGQKDKALGHITKLLKQKPNNVHGYSARASLYAARGQWEKASQDYARAMALTTEYTWVWHHHALLYLQRGDRDGYRKACTRMLQRFSQTKTPLSANDMAWTCTLVPGAVADLSLPMRLAEKALASKPKYAPYLNTFGAVLYRAGRFKAAVQRLNEAIQAEEGKGTYADWLFLAMAHHQLGHKEEARKWLDRAVQWIEQANREVQKGTHTGALLQWNNRLQVQILRREAEALLQGKPAAPTQ